MAYQKYMGYQYETSPRKLQPEYNPTKIPSKKNIENVKKKADNKNKSKVKIKLKAKAKIVIYVTIGFAILFSISYRNSLITESFNKKEELKKNLGMIEKENEQLKVNIENSMNLTNIEQSAEELLGMQKLENSQKKYVNIPKEDYVEPSTKEVIVEEETSWWDKLIKFLTEAQ